MPELDDVVDDVTTPDLADGPDDTGSGADGAAGPDGSGEDALGDAGKKALDAMKARLKAERGRNRQLAADLAAATKQPAAADAPPDLDAIRAEARAEAAAASLRERALDKLEAKAARLLANPEDARAFLGDKADDFIDGNTVDVDAINDALADLLKARPYLGVTQGEPKRFQGTGDGGPRGTAGKPQLTEADVKRLSREGKHAEIEAARSDGRLNDLLGIT
jgi:hypothetical protein